MSKRTMIRPNAEFLVSVIADYIESTPGSSNKKKAQKAMEAIQMELTRGGILESTLGIDCETKSEFPIPPTLRVNDINCPTKKDYPIPPPTLATIDCLTKKEYPLVGQA